MSLNKGLIGHWTMDSADTDNGMLRDRSAYDGDMNIVNSPDIGEDSPIGESYLFDGNEDYTEVEYTPENIESSYTLAFWCYFPSDNDSSSYPVPFANTSSDSSGAGYNGFKWDSGIRFVPSGTDEFNHVSKGIDIEDEWFHLVGVYDDGDAYLYENATVEASDTDFNTPEPLSYINIGGEPRDGEYFNGRISDARFYNRALSEQEINALYNMRSQRLQSNLLDRGLVGYWSMDSIDNDMVRDSSANDNHGEVVGDPQIVDGLVGGEALNFDSGDYVSLGDDSNVTQYESDSMSLFCWYSPNTTSDRVEIIGDGDNVIWGYMIQDGGFRSFIYNDGGESHITDYEPTAGEVYHTGFVYDDLEDKWEIYVNGRVESTYSTIGQIGSGREPDDIRINSYAGDTGDGVIDEVRIYNRVLSESEISRLYNQRQ